MIPNISRRDARYSRAIIRKEDCGESCKRILRRRIDLSVARRCTDMSRYQVIASAKFGSNIFVYMLKISNLAKRIFASPASSARQVLQVLINRITLRGSERALDTLYARMRR